MSAIPTSPDELREAIRSLRDRFEDMEARVDAFSTWLETTDDRVADLEAENEQLRARIDALEQRLTVLEEDATTNGKEAKVRALVQQAENLADDDQRGAVLDVSHIKGATGCSRRYAYDLVEDLPEEYHFIHDRETLPQYGDAEIDWDSRTTGLFVDCEAVHNDPVAVNKFTTRTSSNGGRE